MRRFVASAADSLRKNSHNCQEAWALTTGMWHPSWHLLGELWRQCTSRHNTPQCSRQCIIHFKADSGVWEPQVMGKWPNQDPFTERSSNSFEEGLEGSLEEIPWRYLAGDLPQIEYLEGKPWGSHEGGSALAGAFRKRLQ